ncbi:hypothetical protein INT43_003731 [Umbelopsis isabellina]|uniref:Uncharacterized protein n=1 Tax=Mortierella isabellina TaxID=91625 RepID=A0A8H7PUX4_MORIS|nr:hypothetical protein INT43_003731 [Umbelopsis isabellina]
MTNEQQHYYEKPDAVDENQVYEKPNTLEEPKKFKGEDIVGSALYGLSVNEYDKQYSALEVSDNNTPMSPQQSPAPVAESSSTHVLNVSVVDVQKPNTPKKATATDPEAPTQSAITVPTTEIPSIPKPELESTPTDVDTTRAETRRVETLNSTVLQINKHSFLKPQNHDVYLDGTKKIRYRKIQSHSYHWGFQNVLFSIPLEKQKDKGTAVAETKRQAYQNQIEMLWGKSIGETKPKSDQSEFVNMTTTTLMFIYQFQYNSKTIRWTRPTILSHNLICELIEEPEVSHNNRKLVAEFDSYGMGYLVNVGKLKMNNSVMAEITQNSNLQDLEALLVISCCTLVDLMREVVEKAIGISNGGVAGSA